MTTARRSAALALTLLLGAAGLAPTAWADAAAEVKAAKKIENRDPVEDGTSFAAGDTVYVWSKVTGAEGTKVKHVWKQDDKVVYTAWFTIKGKTWRVNSRRRGLKAGSYVVDVLGDGDAKLGEVSFTVQ